MSVLASRKPPDGLIDFDGPHTLLTSYLLDIIIISRLLDALSLPSSRLTFLTYSHHHFPHPSISHYWPKGASIGPFYNRYRLPIPSYIRYNIMSAKPNVLIFGKPRIFSVISPWPFPEPCRSLFVLTLASSFDVGGTPTITPHIVQYLVPTTGDPKVGSIQIFDRYTIHPPTTYLGAPFKKLLEDRKDIITYSQVNLSNPCAYPPWRPCLSNWMTDHHLFNQCHRPPTSALAFPHRPLSTLESINSGRINLLRNEP